MYLNRQVNKREEQKCRDKVKKNGRLITSHRSTTYPCYLPVLGESAGAGRVRPADANIQLLSKCAIELAIELSDANQLVVSASKRPKINQNHVDVFCFPGIILNQA
ncbi:MAG: hypothetical protein RJB31_1374 [Bacteroidota bacterium]|jgi:hypothetical protein